MKKILILCLGLIFALGVSAKGLEKGCIIKGIYQNGKINLKKNECEKIKSKSKKKNPIITFTINFTSNSNYQNCGDGYFIMTSFDFTVVEIGISVFGGISIESIQCGQVITGETCP